MTSKTTGKPYYFDTRSRRSSYAFPDSAAGPIAAATSAVAAKAASLPPSSSALSSALDAGVAWAAVANAAVIAAGSDVVALRRAVDTICERLNSGGANAQPHAFPPTLDKSARGIVHERVEDNGLKSESVGEDGSRYAVAWHPAGALPTPVLEARAVEAALEAESKVRKAAEIELAKARAAVAAEAKKSQIGGKKRARAALAVDVEESDTTLVIPLADNAAYAGKRERKDFAQIQSELETRRSQAKLIGEGSEHLQRASAISKLDLKEGRVREEDEEEEEIAAG